MTKKLFWLVVAMLPLFFLTSCGGDDTDIDKDQLIGTWALDSRMGEISDVKVNFDKSGYFKLKCTRWKGTTGNGKPVGVDVSEYGKYELEKGIIVLNCTTSNNVYYVKIKSVSDTSMDVEVDTGEGKYNVTANKKKESSMD